MKKFYEKFLKAYYYTIEYVFFKRKSFFTKKNTLLILRLDSIGDYILFRNYLEVIKASKDFKNHTITLCGNSWWKELAENLDKNVIDHFIWIDYAKMDDHKYRFNLYKQLYFKGFETLIHPTYSRDNIGDTIALYSGAKEKVANGGDFVNLTPEQKEINNGYYTALVPSLGNYTFEFERNGEFFKRYLHHTFELDRPRIDYPTSIKNKIIFFPGAKDRFRRWSTKNFAELGEFFKQEFPDDELFIAGSQLDKIFAREIMDASSASFTDVTGNYNLMELIDFISTAKFVVANDSGPFHMSVALGKKVIGISNGNNYGRFMPYPEEMKTCTTSFFPKEIERLPDIIRRKRYCRPIKEIDINETTSTRVFERAKEMLMMQEC